jgi:hypothetical protein
MGSVPAHRNDVSSTPNILSNRQFVTDRGEAKEIRHLSALRVYGLTVGDELEIKLIVKGPAEP